MINVVVEGESDAAFLKSALAELGDTRSATFWVRGSGGTSLAQSLLASNRGEVALVADADAPKGTEAAAERARLLKQLLRAHGRENEDWVLVLFEPELEAALFAKPKLLAELTKKSPDTIAELQALAEVSPRRALEKLGVRDRTELFRKADLSPLASYPPLAALRKFLKKHGVTPKGSTSSRSSARRTST